MARFTLTITDNQNGATKKVFETNAFIAIIDEETVGKIASVKGFDCNDLDIANVIVSTHKTVKAVEKAFPVPAILAGMKIMKEVENDE